MTSLNLVPPASPAEEQNGAHVVDPILFLRRRQFRCRRAVRAGNSRVRDDAVRPRAVGMHPTTTPPCG